MVLTFNQIFLKHQCNPILLPRRRGEWFTVAQMMTLTSDLDSPLLPDQLVTELLNFPVKVFNLNVARTLLLSSAVMYTRDDSKVKLAADYPQNARSFLIQSEEQITKIVSPRTASTIDSDALHRLIIAPVPRSK